MRADAEANREKILDAAREVFGARGIDVPLFEIADHAGVGKGTLYRHFVDRDALILGLVERLQARYAELAVEADSAPTGWDGLAIYLDGVTEMYIELPWTVVVRARARRLTATNGEAERAFRAVLERAWAEGSLRPDVRLTDLAFVTTALSGLTRIREPVRSIVVAQLRDIIFDGLRAEGMPRPALRAEPLDLEQFRAYQAQELGAEVEEVLRDLVHDAG